MQPRSQVKITCCNGCLEYCIVGSNLTKLCIHNCCVRFLRLKYTYFYSPAQAYQIQFMAFFFPFLTCACCVVACVESCSSSSGTDSSLSDSVPEPTEINMHNFFQLGVSWERQAGPGKTCRALLLGHEETNFHSFMVPTSLKNTFKPTNFRNVWQ